MCVSEWSEQASVGRAGVGFAVLVLGGSSVWTGVESPAVTVELFIAPFTCQVLFHVFWGC